MWAIVSQSIPQYNKKSNFLLQFTEAGEIGATGQDAVRLVDLESEHVTGSVIPPSLSMEADHATQQREQSTNTVGRRGAMK